MRCLGCDIVVRSRVKRSFTWDKWQICPKCFSDLVPNFYQKSIKARLEVYHR
jgi:hypothetical protein